MSIALLTPPRWMPTPALRAGKALKLASVCALALACGLSAAHADSLAPSQNIVRFSATATEELTQDLMIVTLQATREGAQAAEVQAGLKQVLDAALTEARKAQGPGLEVRMGAFSVQPRYASTGRISGWQGNAQLVLEGTDTARIAQVVGRLNQMNVNNVAYGLSRAAREQHESRLTSQAIARFQARAAQIASDFGFKGFSLGEVSVSSTEPGFEPRPYMVQAMRAKAMDAAEMALPSEPGKGTLAVTVNGQVQLTP